VVGRTGAAEAVLFGQIENCGRAVRSQRDHDGEGFLSALLGPSVDPPAIKNRGAIKGRQ
jgi:hypothetical protein